MILIELLLLDNLGCRVASCIYSHIPFSCVFILFFSSRINLCFDTVILSSVVPCLCLPPRRHFCPVRVCLCADTPVLSVSASAQTLLSCLCPPSRRHSFPVHVRLCADPPVLSVSVFSPTPLLLSLRACTCARTFVPVPRVHTPRRPLSSPLSFSAPSRLTRPAPPRPRSASPPIRLARYAQLHRLPSGTVVAYNWNTTPLTKHHSFSYRNILICPPHSTSCHVGLDPYPQQGRQLPTGIYTHFRTSYESDWPPVHRPGRHGSAGPHRSGPAVPGGVDHGLPWCAPRFTKTPHQNFRRN